MQYAFSNISRAVCAVLVLATMVTPADVWAQTGVSDDRVSLPEGPGSLEGVGENVEMDPNMGNMRFSVPIEVPQGFPAVTPDVTLRYSSGGGSGMIGMGWSMSLPSVERMTYRGLPQYQQDDDFSANGSDQLVRLPGSNPPTYRARYEKGFVRYTWMDAGQGAEGYWEAEYPDGSKGYFGATAEGVVIPDSRLSGDRGIFRYMLVEKVDVYGHTMRVSYTKEEVIRGEIQHGVVPLPQTITYGFQANPEEPAYRVEFSYEERRDATGFDYLSDAKPGFNERLTQRLARIDLFARRSRIRSYRLAYESYDASGGFTRLTRVETLGLEQGVYPQMHTFGYSQALGGQQPAMVSMGSLGISLGEGHATLLDINGDALPDIVDTSQNGPHRFFINTPNAEGSSSFNVEPVLSRLPAATGASIRLGRGNPGVQVLDANGDGFSDLLNARTGTFLMNLGTGDWVEGSINGLDGVGSALEGDFDFEDGGLQSLRFIDYNNDKKIDLMRATPTDTTFMENEGASGFSTISGVDRLGVSFDADGVQLSDMNGDGLIDVVVVSAGQLRYKLNYGWGRWSPFVTIDGLPITNAEIAQTELEDINGDGLSDLVVVSGSVIKYALNTNGAEFSLARTITTNDVEGDLPERVSGMTVLFADMNANGSSDVVYVDASGRVQYLELFPVRPNLLNRIENGLGQVTAITYGSSVQQQALDRAEGLPDWETRLPHPMLVVTKIDKYERLTGDD
ncbi:MAG: SpvB/TcaC N-terminal domain-containing protein, partial [Myxococcota bacterium]